MRKPFPTYADSPSGLATPHVLACKLGFVGEWLTPLQFPVITSRFENAIWYQEPDQKLLEHMREAWPDQDFHWCKITVSRCQ